MDNSTIRPYSLAVLAGRDRVITASNQMGLPDWDSRSARYEHEHDGLHLQLWRLSDLTLLKTVALQAPEGQDVNLMPAEPRVLADGRSVLVTTIACGLYRVRGLDADEFAADFIYRFEGRDCAVPLRIGKFWVQSVPTTHRVIVLDVSDPSRPFEVGRVQFDERQQPHWLSFDAIGNRIVVVNNPAGEPRVWMLQFDRTSGRIVLDESFRDSGSERAGVSFDRPEWPHGTTGPAIPHGSVFVQ